MDKPDHTAQIANEHLTTKQELSGETESASESPLELVSESTQPSNREEMSTSNAKGHLSRDRKRPLAGWDDFPIVELSGVFSTEKRALNPFAVVVKQVEPCDMDEESYILAIKKHFGACGTIVSRNVIRS